MPTTLDSITNEPEVPSPPRDLVRTGIHLAVFGAWIAGTAYGSNYLAEMTSQNKWAEIAFPVFFFGSIPALIGLQYATSKVLDRVRPYRKE